MKEKNLNKDLSELSFPHFEEYVLGTIISYPFSLFAIQNFTSAVFFDEKNRCVAEAIENIVSKSGTINILNIASEIVKTDIMDKSEVIPFLTDISSKCNPDGIFKQYSFLAEYYMRRKLIQECNEAIQKAYDLKADILTNMSTTGTSIKGINTFLAVEATKSYKDILNERLRSAQTIAQSKDVLLYGTGDDNFDAYIGFNPNEIMFISGESGSCKTRFTLMKIFKLLENNYKKVSVFWNTFEDSKDDIIDMYLSSKIFATKKQIQGKSKEKINANQIKKMHEVIEKMEDYDVVFNEDKLTVAEIRKRFVTFCDSRRDRFCICVIDNVMLLREHRLKMDQLKIDDLIASEIKDTLDASKTIAKSSIVLLHHLNSDYANKNNLKYGYKPTKNNMKGSTRYHDIANMVVTINFPKLHSDLIDAYPEYKDMMKSLFIVSSEKSRNDAGVVIRYLSNIDYNLFVDVDVIKAE